MMMMMMMINGWKRRRFSPSVIFKRIIWLPMQSAPKREGDQERTNFLGWELREGISQSSPLRLTRQVKTFEANFGRQK
jgi:hypothetical protein